MVNDRINISVETILAGLGKIPGCVGLFTDKAYSYNTLNALETVFPRDDKTNWSSILAGDR